MTAAGPVTCWRCRHDYRQHNLTDGRGTCWQPMRDEAPCGCPGWTWVDPAGSPATDGQQLPAAARS